MAKNGLTAKDMIYGMIFFIPAAIISVFKDSVFLGMLCGFGVFLAFMIIKSLILLPGKKKKEREENERNRRIIFYERCIANGVSSFESEKDKQRAATIAQNNNCGEIKNYVVFFEEGKKLYLEKKAVADQKITNERLAKLRKEEEEESKKLSKYAYYKGNDKTVSILSEKAQSLRSAKSFAENFGSQASSVLLEKEKDWATAGGIASGIAGTAAGVATALDVQAKNAEIRARNEQKKQMISDANMYIHQSGAINKLSGNLSSVEYELTEAKEKLIKQLPDEKILDYMNISDTKITISETGAFRVSVNVSMSKKLIIFDDVDAHIDGTLVCVLSQNGKPVGEAPLVLPFDGIYYSAEQKINLNGICLSGADKNLDYTVAFSGKHLYAIEN